MFWLFRQDCIGLGLCFDGEQVPFMLQLGIVKLAFGVPLPGHAPWSCCTRKSVPGASTVTVKQVFASSGTKEEGKGMIELCWHPGAFELYCS